MPPNSYLPTYPYSKLSPSVFPPLMLILSVKFCGTCLSKSNCLPIHRKFYKTLAKFIEKKEMRLE